MAEELRVAISIGHTPGHPGAVHASTNLKEHDICLRYRNVLLSLLEYDRRIDAHPILPGLGIDDRVEAVNSVHADDPVDLAIDLHMNANRDPAPNYAEVYHYASRSGQSSIKGKIYGDAFLIPLAAIMGSGDGKRDGLSEPFGDEAWERERYEYVRGVDAPALVVEPAFLSNDDTAREIIEGGLIPTMAMGCYRGLVACLEA